MLLPSFLQIEPVGQCNLRCRMCPIQFRRDGPPYGPPAFLSVDRFKKIIDEMTSLTELHLQGLGEPLLHPHFFDMVSYAAGRGIDVSTNSNLTLLTAKNADHCLTSGLNGLFVSIDGATADTYEWVRPGAKFDDVIRNLKALVAWRKERRAAKPKITVVMVLMRKNVAELPALVALAISWGVESMSVQHLCHDFNESTLPAHYKDMRDFIDEQMLTEADVPLVEPYFERARTVAAAASFDLKIPNLSPVVHAADKPGRERCDWPWRGAYLSYDGKAMPCCMVATPDRANFGSAFENGLSDVWENDAYEEFRRRLSSDDPPEVCRSCSVYKGTF